MGVHRETNPVPWESQKFAVDQLTDIVYVELPEVGSNYEAGEVFGNIESVKAVSDLYAPVAGEVIEVNQPVVDDPGILSEDAYEKGWMIKLKVSDKSGHFPFKG